MAVKARRGPREPFDRLDDLTPAGLRSWWTRRVRKVLEIAASELPFYRRRFAESGFDAASFRSLDDLDRLPTWRKRDVLAEQQRAGSHALGIERLPTDTVPNAI